MTRVCSNINSRARHFTYPLDHGVLILVATFDSPKIHQRPSQRVDTCLSVVARHPEPVTHIITKLGLWFSAGPEELYQSNVEAHVENVYDVLGGRPSSTPYPSPHRSCE